MHVRNENIHIQERSPNVEISFSHTIREQILITILKGVAVEENHCKFQWPPFHVRK